MPIVPQINRYAVVPNKDTPYHISNIRIFDSEDQAIAHAAMIRGTVEHCTDTDAIHAFNRGEEVRRRHGVTA